MKSIATHITFSGLINACDHPYKAPHTLCTIKGRAPPHSLHTLISFKILSDWLSGKFLSLIQPYACIFTYFLLLLFLFYHCIYFLLQFFFVYYLNLRTFSQTNSFTPYFQMHKFLIFPSVNTSHSKHLSQIINMQCLLSRLFFLLPHNNVSPPYTILYSLNTIILLFSPIYFQNFSSTP